MTVAGLVECSIVTMWLIGKFVIDWGFPLVTLKGQMTRYGGTRETRTVGVDGSMSMGR